MITPALKWGAFVGTWVISTFAVNKFFPEASGRRKAAVRENTRKLIGAERFDAYVDRKQKRQLKRLDWFRGKLRELDTSLFQRGKPIQDQMIARSQKASATPPRLEKTHEVERLPKFIACVMFRDTLAPVECEGTQPEMQKHVDELLKGGMVEYITIDDEEGNEVSHDFGVS